ncbi:YciI family protein [Luteimonas wenzhouensis]|jgi:hypothetical protein|uniref:YciI family protein n=1 Tax=Luteimonas wenzhouensis TaxID=2599615 RepID=A0A5C5U1H8_9GAMM|nr:YciI family protein [Luteimonas wenzhouensis]NLW97916.1 YciI family protein [Xanthomonadaceae bacterium]TWT19538.1 YciI family protein [Luteimonas wenzhouensis]
MQYLLLVYIDEALQEALPEGEYERRMRHCLERADELKAGGTLVDYRQLERPATAKSVRRRNGKVSVVDGPFAETKEILAGFNLVEADSLEEALELAAQFPWAETGCIEVRPVRDVAAVRRQVGARPAHAPA